MAIRTHGLCDSFDWLFLDMNSYFASVEQQDKPELRGRPIIVIPVDSDATSAIAASYEAKSYGIKTNTRVYEAKRMCPELVCVPAHHDLYVEYHDRFLKAIDLCIPVHTIASIDEVACELQGEQRTLQGGTKLALTIKRTLAQHVGEFVRCSIGLSSNRLLAKIAAETMKPNGLVAMTPDGVLDALKDKPLTTLPGIGQNMQARLHRCGIWNIEQLMALPPKHMRKIWGGVGGERYYHSLRGVQLPELPTTKRTIGHSHVLDPNWRPTPLASYVARRLLLKAASRLRRYGLNASKISLSMRIEHGQRVEASGGFDAACDTVNLMREMMQLWEQLVQQWQPERLKKLSVTLHGLRDPQDAQTDLLDILNISETTRKKRYEQLSGAMDRLNERFGRDTITMGGSPKEFLNFSGTKIAFSRIPEKQEFHE